MNHRPVHLLVLFQRSSAIHAAVSATFKLSAQVRGGQLVVKNAIIVAESDTLPALVRMDKVVDSLPGLRRLAGGLIRLRYHLSNVIVAEDRITWQGTALLPLIRLGMQRAGTRHAISASKRAILPETVPKILISRVENINMLAFASPEYLCCL